MNVGDLVRVMHSDPGTPDRVGMSATIVALTPLYATLRLTASGQVVTLPRADLLYVERTAMTVVEWRREYGSWQRRNARVIAKLEAWREERGLAA